MNLQRVSWFISIFLLLTACAAPPPRADPEALFEPPSSWSTEQESRADDVPQRWWIEFGDPALDTSLE